VGDLDSNPDLLAWKVLPPLEVLRQDPLTLPTYLGYEFKLLSELLLNSIIFSSGRKERAFRYVILAANAVRMEHFMHLLNEKFYFCFMTNSYLSDALFFRTFSVSLLISESESLYCHCIRKMQQNWFCVCNNVERAEPDDELSIETQTVIKKCNSLNHM